ncbi:MAG: hypothetical protein QGI78_01870 [Phycisphaerales bacterium]|jgi:hypothetical protein|nr:hypothetical protein [Phycisphaerales bacterium]
MRITITLAAILAVYSTTLGETVPTNTTTRLNPIPLMLEMPRSLRATFRNPKAYQNTNKQTRGTCPQTPVTRTDSDFGVGQYVLQAGFAQGESLAATYDVPADEFPIRVDLAEVLFATSNTNVQTTTHWSVYIWDGTPTNGFLVAQFSSDNIILPHLVMPPGTTGTIISVSVDPEDPEQIYIYNDSGQNKFTVAFGIDQHNNPGNPCTSSPPTNSNAFPTTDTSGLQFPDDNWIDAVSGPWCVCGTGWFTFQDFPSICTPSGDWVLRAAYTSVNCTIEPVACCVGTECFDLTPTDCEALGGLAQNPETTCATYVCGAGEGACCIEATGACVEFDVNTCLTVGGIHMGEGTSCAETTCFPEGACCLHDGNCIGPISPEDCVAVAGSFQGDATTCASVSCPQPLGACCGDDWCLDLTEDDCSAVVGTWEGMDSHCDDTNVCGAACAEDINGDGVIDVNDLLEIVGGWGSHDPDLDVDGNGVVNTDDLLAVIAAWGVCE